MCVCVCVCVCRQMKTEIKQIEQNADNLKIWVKSLWDLLYYFFNFSVSSNFWKGWRKLKKKVHVWDKGCVWIQGSENKPGSGPSKHFPLLPKRTCTLLSISSPMSWLKGRWPPPLTQRQLPTSVSKSLSFRMGAQHMTQREKRSLSASGRAVSAGTRGTARAALSPGWGWSQHKQGGSRAEAVSGRKANLDTAYARVLVNGTNLSLKFKSETGFHSWLTMSPPKSKTKQNKQTRVTNGKICSGSQEVSGLADTAGEAWIAMCLFSKTLSL